MAWFSLLVAFSPPYVPNVPAALAEVTEARVGGVLAHNN